MPEIKKAKPQLKNLDALFGLENDDIQGKLIIQEIPIDSLIHFNDHPFHLYEGERLEDMVDSIKSNGVLVPVIVRRKQGDDKVFEILAGHNRINAGKMAGLSTVPAVVLDGISDDEAMIYVVETNLMQRSFSDMSHTEKAAVISMHKDKMFSQGKRNDILEQLKALESHNTVNNPTSSKNGTELVTGLRTDEKIGAMYSLSRNTIARYLRLNRLSSHLKQMLDNSKITFLVAVEISFLNKQEQEWLGKYLEDGFSVNTAKATALREHSKDGMLDFNAMANILTGQTGTAAAENKPRNVKVSGELYSRYFKPEQSAKEVAVIVEEALLQYFGRVRSVN